MKTNKKQIKISCYWFVKLSAVTSQPNSVSSDFTAYNFWSCPLALGFTHRCVFFTVVKL